MSRSGIFVLVIILFLVSEWAAVNYLGWGIQRNQFQEYFDKKVIVEGNVVSDPLPASFGQINYEVQPITKYSQKILVSSSAKTPVRYGEQVYLIGKIKQPKNFNEYNYVNFLKSKNVYAQMTADAFVITPGYGNLVVYFGLKVKHFVYKKFQQSLPKEQAALLIALIVGQKNLMSKNAIAAFQIAGVAHLIAVSGFILTLLILFAERLSVYLGWKKTWALCFLIAVIYLVMADFAAGVVRAGIMSGVYLISKKINRQYNLLVALGLSAAVMVLLDPLIIRYDIGFALSFLSIVGITLFTPIFKILLSKIPETFQIREIMAVTLAAQTITLPLTIYYFKQISVLAVLVNVVIVPIVPLVLSIGYFLCIPFVRFLVAKILLIPLNFILIFVFAVAKIKWASLNIAISSNVVVVIYLVEGGLYLLALPRLKEDLIFVKME